MPSEIAWDVFNELGECGKVALDSKVINYDNPFVKSYRRCEELLTKINSLRMMLTQCKDWINFELREVKEESQVWRGFRELIV